jgi:hypothetical protein
MKIVVFRDAALCAKRVSVISNLTRITNPSLYCVISEDLLSVKGRRSKLKKDGSETKTNKMPAGRRVGSLICCSGQVDVGGCYWFCRLLGSFHG